VRQRRIETANPPERPGPRAGIALIGLIIVWGLSVPVIKLGLRDFTPLTPGRAGADSIA
jgi:hypothetical protein